jgi:hypothetical protein
MTVAWHMSRIAGRRSSKEFGFVGIGTASFIGLRGTLAQVTVLSGSLGLPRPEDDGATHSSELIAFTREHGTRLARLADLTPTMLDHDLAILVASS